MLSSAVPVTEVDVAELQSWLKVIADPKRLRIINLLMQGVQCNCELGDQLGMPRNLISHHLGILREAGLVAVERDDNDARWVYYSINPTALNELNELFAGFFDPVRIQPRQVCCGPQATLISLTETDLILPRN